MKQIVVLLAIVVSIQSQTEQVPPFLSSFGRCRQVETAKVDTSTWAGQRYTSVISADSGTTCNYAQRYLKLEEDGYHLATTLSRIQNGKTVVSTTASDFVRDGVYNYSANIFGGEPTNFYVTFMHYDPKTKLSCQFVCTDDPRVKGDNSGRNGFFHCLSGHPCPQKSDAALIKSIAEKNNFDLDKLDIADNTNCANFPSNTKHAKCTKYTTKEFFDLH